MTNSDSEKDQEKQYFLQQASNLKRPDWLPGTLTHARQIQAWKRPSPREPPASSARIRTRKPRVAPP